MDEKVSPQRYPLPQRGVCPSVPFSGHYILYLYYRIATFFNVHKNALIRF